MSETVHARGILFAEGRARVAARVTERPAAPRTEYPLKRWLDVAVAGVALAVSLPLWAIIALAIKLEDGGPVLYAQRRWGRRKTPITVHKFRSMRWASESVDGSVQARADDPRVTTVGRWLRATSLDELPQILSIWRGEMSWVGPRALPINEVQVNEAEQLPDEAIPGFDARSQVTPGLTGIAQVYAPRDVPRAKKFRYDCLYIRRQSLALDLHLVLVSLWITARGNWSGQGRARRRGRSK